MIKIARSKDCGNSPKNKFVEDVEIAFATRDLEFLLDSVTDDIHWHIVGGSSVRGRDAFAEAIKSNPQNTQVTEITIHHVMTHGKAGAVNGTVMDGKGRTFDFCSVYEFSNAKGTSIREITSYIIARA